MPEVDVIQCSVVQNRLKAITEEMGQTILRTTRSPILSEGRDFITAIFDGQGRVVAQTEFIPVLSAATPPAVLATQEMFDGDIHPGDIFILNDPYNGGNHLPDVTLLKPVFSTDGAPAFWIVDKGHQADIGGNLIGGYNPYAKEVYQEGIRIPPLRLHDRGRLRQDVWHMLGINSRLKAIFQGDLNAQLSALRTGEQGVTALLEKYGAAQLHDVLEAILDATERRVRSEIAAMPNGAYSGRSELDHDGFNRDEPIRVAVAITIDDESLHFDFTGSHPQVTGFVNSSLANTLSACYIAMFTIMDPDIPHNEGWFRAVSVHAPEGSIVNALEPAPTTMCTVSTAEAIIEACWRAFAEAIPERAPAAWGRSLGPVYSGYNPRTGRRFSDIAFLKKSGAGAVNGHDGWHHVGPSIACGGLRAPSVEMHESIDPFLLRAHEYRADSGGAGRWRGGCGVDYVFEVYGEDCISAVTGDGNREATRAFGQAGGLPGVQNLLYLDLPDGSRTVAESKMVYEMPAGTVFHVYSAGGGGWGDPHERDPQAVLQDVRNGIVTIDKAQRDYGVAIDPQRMTIDAARTAQLRHGGC